MSCPICKKPKTETYRPFCSKRCADIDLGKWLKGDYSVPSEDPVDIDQAVNEAPDLKPSIH